MVIWNWMLAVNKNTRCVENVADWIYCFFYSTMYLIHMALCIVLYNSSKEFDQLFHFYKYII